MKKTELEQWAEDFWERYKILCRTPYKTKWTGGSKGECIRAILKLNPSADLRDRMLEAVEAQTQYRQQLYDRVGAKYEDRAKEQKICRTRMGSTWVNQMAWHDEIPELSESQQFTDNGEPVQVCRWEGCTDGVTAQGYCAWHYTKACAPEQLDIHAKWLRDNGLTKQGDETREQWLERCREHGKQLLKTSNYGQYIPGVDQ